MLKGSMRLRLGAQEQREIGDSGSDLGLALDYCQYHFSTSSPTSIPGVDQSIICSWELGIRVSTCWRFASFASPHDCQHDRPLCMILTLLRSNSRSSPSPPLLGVCRGWRRQSSPSKSTYWNASISESTPVQPLTHRKKYSTSPSSNILRLIIFSRRKEMLQSLELMPMASRR